MDIRGKLDPRLRVMLDRRQFTDSLIEAAESVRVPMAEESAGPAPEDSMVESVEVVLRCREFSYQRLLAYEGVVRAVVEGPEIIVSAAVPAPALDPLSREPWILEIEAARELYNELDLSLVECRGDVVHGLNPSVRGNGVLIGIIDTGIDFRHADFRNADGSSRILFLWDQSATTVAGGTVPFGRVFTKAELDAVLLNTPGASPIAHRDTDGHGTHVAGIAAGNGRSKSPARFTGLAPESELIVVRSRSDNGTLGQSNSAIAAFSFITTQAAALQRPVSINMSQGMNSGGHSGESALEEAMDILARVPGVAIVKSAGNEQNWRTHAGGNAVAGQTVILEVEVVGGNVADDIIEIWHDGDDHFAVAVQPPGAASPAAAAFVVIGGTSTASTSAGNEVQIESTIDASNTGDVRTIVFLGRGTANFIQPGTWRLHLRADAIRATGRYDLWIERTDRRFGGIDQARFTQPSFDPTRTISIPGTARRIITVGSYVTRQGSVGDIAIYSSRGPTRYGIRKPEIAAPGSMIASTLSTAATQRTAFQTEYTLEGGTSMAAPHVAGAAALLLQINRDLTCTQIAQLLMRAAARTGAASSAPDDTWGGGKLDVEEGIRLARTVTFPVITNVTVSGTVISWRTNIATTGAVRFNTHQRRMLLGRAAGSLADLTLATQHSIDLRGQPSGTYFCEILAFTQDNWQTIDDDAGRHYRVVV